jgi:CheY-like chemotaxis protein
VTRVLVVDDSSLLCDLLAELLCDFGHDVEKVHADFARLLLPGWSGWDDVDVLVSDLNLSDPLTGVDLLTACAAHHPRIRRVAWTGSASELAAAAATVADHVVTKPGIDEVLAIVKQGRRT